MLAGIFAAAVDSLDTPSLSGSWADCFAAHPSSATNEDRTISWTVGGTRTVTITGGGVNTLQYRIDSGSYTAYTTGFSLTSGQTVGWRYNTDQGNDASALAVNVYVNHQLIDTFQVQGTGVP